MSFDPRIRLYIADDVDRYDSRLQQQLFVLQNEVRAARERGAAGERERAAGPAEAAR